MQRIEARIGKGGKGVRAAGQKHLAAARADQIARKGDAHGACGAGIHDVCRLACRAEHVGNIAGNGGGGHFENVRPVLLALQPSRVIVINAGRSAHAATQNHAGFLQIGSGQAAVRQRLLRRFQAQPYRAVVFRRRERFTAHLGAHVRDAALGGYTRHLADAGVSLAGIFPAGLNVIADCADQTQSGNRVAAHCSIFAAT